MAVRFCVFTRLMMAVFESNPAQDLTFGPTAMKYFVKWRLSLI
jgi:hypothetical protein